MSEERGNQEGGEREGEPVLRYCAREVEDGGDEGDNTVYPRDREGEMR
jgi:hypothetical protein